MSERVDELFGAAGTETRPRYALAVGLLLLGTVVSVAGMVCTVIPGVLVVLLAWFVVQRDLDRVDSGFLPLTDRPTLIGLRALVWSGVGGVSLLTLVQLAGLWVGGYQQWWSFVIEGLGSPP